jgi:putative phosphoesterase
MPRLALVSDTHLPRFGRRLPAALIEALEAARPQVILHLGDHTAAAVVDELAVIAPVEAVAGNNDPPELVARYGLRRVVEIDTVRIGMTHGHLGRGATTPVRALAAFGADSVQIVAFGHSHIPLVEWRGATLLVNPGSPTDRRRQPQPTFALLDVTAGVEPTARIVPLPLPQPKRARRCSTS